MVPADGLAHPAASIRTRMARAGPGEIATMGPTRTRGDATLADWRLGQSSLVTMTAS
jgi:hypothetical protein